MTKKYQNCGSQTIYGNQEAEALQYRQTSKTSTHISNIMISKAITVLPAKIDSDFMLCLQSNQGLIIDRSLVY